MPNFFLILGSVPDDPTPPTLSAGRTVKSMDSGREYRIGPLLGRGGFGSVYRCHAEDEPDVELAIKATHDQAGWIRELYFDQLLHHVDGAVHVHDSFPLTRAREGQVVYLAVMDLAKGGDLYDFLRGRNAPLAEGRVVVMFTRLLRVLSHLHEGGAVHRDLTPANVFFDDRDRVLLGDFGIARHRLRQKGVPADVFNPWFRPPEVGEAIKRWSAEQDLWQVGQLLVSVLLNNPDGTLDARDIRRLDCSDWMKEVVYRAIGPREFRFHDAAAMSDALNRKALALDDLPQAHPTSLRGKRIVLTARFRGMVQSEVAARAKKKGAVVQRGVTYDTDFLVVGNEAPLYAAGSAGSKVMTALAFNERGADIRVLRPSQLLRLS